MSQVVTTTVALPLSLDDQISKNNVQETVTDIDDLPSPSFERSVDELTLEEKLDILSGVNFTHTNGVPRLGVPPLKVVDTITGVKGSEHFQTPTLCFPSATCMGATWNVDLLSQVGTKLALQTKSKSAQVLLGPVLNLHRDPRGGRNFESFSEDPLLAGELAASLVNAIQAGGVATCPKHFVGNESETKRRFHNVAENLDGRTMREIYLAAWQVMLRKSQPAAIMTAYNKVDGLFCSENPRLIKDLLRGEWAYDGALMSDWYGTRSGVPALEAGLDLEMPGPTIHRSSIILEKIKSGELDISVLNQRAAKVLELVKQTKESYSEEEETSFVDEAANLLARQVATEGIVLLQNRKSVLPLRKSQRLAVVGSQATIPSISGGGSAAAPPQYSQRPLDSIRALSADPENIQSADGVKMHNIIPTIPVPQIFARDGSNGINVRYFNNGSDQPVIDEIHPAPAAVMFGRLRDELKPEAFNYEISTTVIPKTTGLHTIGARTTGSCVVKVNGKEVAQKTMVGIEVEDFLFRPKNLEVLAQVQMTAGVPYFVDLIVQPHKPSFATGEPIIHSAMLCYMEEYSDDEAIAEVVNIAKEADVTLIFAGRTPEHESEGFDAQDMSLPASQVKMIKAVAAASRRSVLILSCGNPIDVQDFVEDVDAVVNAHFLGQEGGSALAEILYGEASPSGKLAVSWPKTLKDSPSYPHYPATETARGSWEMTCGEGLGLGYRHEWTPRTLQWPFGFGLSYTNFEISSLQGSRSNASGVPEDGEIIIEAIVSNTGAVDGSEVVQVFVEDVASSVSRPQKELKGFTKINVAAGKSEKVSIMLKDKYAFSFWDESTKMWKCEAGQFKIHVGEFVESVSVDQDFFWSGL
ncbi:glycoside hydrolase family 3 protein [Cadophora sp. DSE1049]|nr:glycoside hydrolase family 3 protein [Cadophora sp. DSE1049]